METMTLPRHKGRFVRGNYEVVRTNNGYAVKDNGLNCGSIIFTYETGNEFMDWRHAVGKCEKLELAELNRYTNPEGRY